MLAAPLPKSIATVSLSGTLPDKLEAAASAGFDGVEIMEGDLLAFDGKPEAVRRMADSLGLAITAYQPFRDFEAMPEPQRARNLARAERKFDLMQALGAGLLLVCSNTNQAAIDDNARAAADLAQMAELAARRGLRVGYEALAWGRHVSRWRQAWDVVQQAGHPALGLIVDSFHTLALNDDPTGLSTVPGDRIFLVQLADAPLLSMDVLSWSRHFRSFPGQGELDVSGFMRAVLASGYAGPLSLEVFNDDFRAGPARMTARDGLRSLIFAEAEAGGGTPMPAVPRVDGIEFIEFAVDDQARMELAVLLTKLGFRLAGRHRSKAVDLFRQGGINLVLNAEQDSSAAEHFQLHGPSVCAMALRVGDVQQAIARAGALLTPDWGERIGTGERRIPAVRAADGTLLYLVGPGDVAANASGRNFWEDDFHLFAGDDAGSGLLAVDHLALALPPGRMGSHVLFWRALFGLVPQPLYDLPDPFGIVRSRAMVDPEGRLRVTLNISEARGTGTNRFVSAYFGAGVHHIAFAASDAGRSVEHLRAAQAPMLEIPANYYEDLAARLNLDNQQIAILKDRCLLYDRDGSGEFRQAYTAGFHHRFFFEVVERQSGYAGFGAANAPVRMAAQARAEPLFDPSTFDSNEGAAR
jgi:4-hydroxyphenylpyruvate dioxygenase